MARRRYRRYYRKRRSYAPNIEEINQTLTASPGTFTHIENLALNPSQTDLLVSQKCTVKNFSIDFVIENENYDEGTLNIEALCVYIMYVPQGYDLDENAYPNYNIDHPEFILAYKYIGSPSSERTDAYGTNFGAVEVKHGQHYQPHRIRSRLGRKLNTGDSIVMFVKGINQSQDTTYTLRINGLVRWWSKAN